MSNLFWKRVGGYYHINTTGIHARNTDAVVTMAINRWIASNQHTPHVARSYLWLILYLDRIKSGYYPAQGSNKDQAIAEGGTYHRSWLTTRHMLKYYLMISEYYQWWFGQLACHGKCLTVTGNLEQEVDLSRRLVGTIIEEAVQQMGWFVVKLDSDGHPRWKETQGRHHREYHDCDVKDYYNLLVNLVEPGHDNIGGYGPSGYVGTAYTTVFVTSEHLTRERLPQPQKYKQLPKHAHKHK